MSSARPAVVFEHVSKRFILHHDRPRSFQEWLVRRFRPNDDTEEFWALRDVSFSVGRGEAVAFVGTNGAGKSSLLKLINGILTPTEGAVIVDGRISALLELGAGFHPDLTGRENVYLNGSILGLDRRTIDHLYPHIVKFAEIEDFIDMPVKHYSSGMYMRLGFAVAIHAEPDILLVDEVLAVGDAAFQAKCMHRILDLKKRGVTIIIVSHDLEAVRKLCNRVFWLQNSRVRQAGPPSQVLAAYLDWVAQHQMDDMIEEAEEEAELAAERAAQETATVAEAEAAPTPAPTAPTAPTPRPTSKVSAPSALRHPDATRWGTYEVEITGVEFLDGAGRPAQAFDTGGPFTARIHYDAHQPIPHPMIGVAIHIEDGAHVTGPNTVTSDFDIPVLEGQGWVDYIVDDLPLVAGTYVFTAAIYDFWETKAYDHHDKTFVFRVRPGSPERYGAVVIPSRWAHAAAESQDTLPSTPVKADRLR
ncbi:MAG: ABC transporter ATP-binding protein [Anaerolineae bacterium]